jgi:hypothetical protein
MPGKPNHLKQLAGPACSDGTTCPGVFLDEANDRILIRGPLSPTSLPLGDGEQLVEIPIGMLAQAASELA